LKLAFLSLVSFSVIRIWRSNSGFMYSKTSQSSASNSSTKIIWFSLQSYWMETHKTYFEMWLWSQRPLHVQKDAGWPGWQGGGQEKNNRKKWRAKEERQKE
jgi:hypothetical protein